MIYDHLRNAALYWPLGENFKKALSYLSFTDFNKIEPGKYCIDDYNVFSIVQEYQTKLPSAGKWEAHNNYADIQYVFSGKEKMGFAQRDQMTVVEAYNQEKDIIIFQGEGNHILVESGFFTIFFPTDVHLPGIALDIPGKVKKVVVKVRV